MNEADRLVLELLQPHMSNLGYALVKAKVTEAGGIVNLRDSVALAELELAKRKFGSRTEAARYAAEIRWQKGRAEQFKPQQTTHRVYPQNAEGEIRVATLNGKATEFHVTQVAAGNIKVGDMVSSGRGSDPRKVVDIVRIGGPETVTLVTQSLERGNTATRELTAAKTSKVSRWAVAGQSTGALDPSRRVDSTKIDARSRRYIDEAPSPQEKIRRRNEVIDWYAGQGVDVTPTKRGGARGGTQWLME